MEHYKQESWRHSRASAVVLPLQRFDPIGASNQRRGPSADANTHEFTLECTLADDGTLIIRVYDDSDGAYLTSWSGPVAASLLAADPLRGMLSAGSSCVCTKDFVRKLMLAASAATSTLAQLQQNVSKIIGEPDPTGVSLVGQTNGSAVFADAALAERLRRADAGFSLDTISVARMLFRYPGEHFSASDVQSLLMIHYPMNDCHGVDECLDALAAQHIIQRIEIAPSLVFFDIDVTPHAHRYDWRTGELHDA